ncbi:hypothetical protein [Haloplanus aerogenes]|uniref:hypothetical protein n=1 Tax=Haloplanus aerogenes TaxID=660522 RepID=UPI001314D414|nr:hypothetical protein [Haloplanus aerogenes]
MTYVHPGVDPAVAVELPRWLGGVRGRRIVGDGEAVGVVGRHRVRRSIGHLSASRHEDAAVVQCGHRGETDFRKREHRDAGSGEPIDHFADDRPDGVRPDCGAEEDAPIPLRKRNAPLFGAVGRGEPVEPVVAQHVHRPRRGDESDVEGAPLAGQVRAPDGPGQVAVEVGPPPFVAVDAEGGDPSVLLDVESAAGRHGRIAGKVVVPLLHPVGRRERSDRRRAALLALVDDVRGVRGRGDDGAGRVVLRVGVGTPERDCRRAGRPRRIHRASASRTAARQRPRSGGRVPVAPDG